MSQRQLAASRCSSCGAKTVEYRHRLGECLGTGLRSLARAGGGPVNLKDLGLTRNQWDNFQKLRYWDLAHKVFRADGSRVAGNWRITPLGWSFIRREVLVHEYVWTYRGQPVRSEGSLISIDDLAPGYEVRADYALASVPAAPERP